MSLTWQHRVSGEPTAHLVCSGASRRGVVPTREAQSPTCPRTFPHKEYYLYRKHYCFGWGLFIVMDFILLEHQTCLHRCVSLVVHPANLGNARDVTGGMVLQMYECRMTHNSEKIYYFSTEYLGRFISKPCWVEKIRRQELSSQQGVASF